MKPRVIRLEYEIKVKGGETIESSAQRGPLEIVLGQKRLLPALEQRIAELSAGEEAIGQIAAAEAFGNDELLPIKEIPRHEFPAGEKLTVGRVFEAKAADEQEVRFRIVESNDEVVRVRFLHPLAESDLEYWVKVLAIESPSRRPAPPPMPAQAIGIDSAAIQIVDSTRIELFDDRMSN